MPPKPPTQQSDSPAQRVAHLRTQLNRANHDYYVLHTPTMSDPEFDRLLTELASLEHQHPELDDPDSPTHRVGGEPIDGFTTITHARPMLSIDNSYSEDDVRAWYARCLESLDLRSPSGLPEGVPRLRGGGGLFEASPSDPKGASPRSSLPPLFLDPKIDGLAISLRYEQGKLIHAATRGDGTKGDDVTHAARVIQSIPLVLTPTLSRSGGKGAQVFEGSEGDLTSSAIPEILEVRGEVYLPLSQFERINKEREEQGEDLFMNPRNAAAGTLKNLDPKLIASRRLGFFAHGIGEFSSIPLRASGGGAASSRRGRSASSPDEPDAQARVLSSPTSHSSFLALLRHFNFPTNPFGQRCATIDEALTAINAFNTKRHSLNYATDGMVLRIDDFDLQQRLGLTSKSPRWAIAYKYPAERKTTILLDVAHQVGKTGKITPRATMQPVVLAGTTVQHATLHNYGTIRRMDAHIGDTIEIEKAGEIIPYVIGVLRDLRPDHATPIDAPTQCPVCNGEIEIEYDQKRLLENRRYPQLPDYINRDTKQLTKTVSEKRRKEIVARLERDKASLAKGTPAPIGPMDESGRYCINPECPAQIQEKLIWFAGRKQMNIEGLGERTIELLRQAKSVPLDSFGDIFRLKAHREAVIDALRSGDKKTPAPVESKRFDKLIQGIENAKSRGLAKVLAGLGIRHVGEVTSKLLAKKFRTADALLAASTDDLMSATSAERDGSPDADAVTDSETGLGEDTASTVHQLLHSPAMLRTFADLKGLGVRLDSKDIEGDSATRSSPIAGKRIVVTGTLTRFDRESIKSFLESLGAKVSSSVSSATDFVVAGESPGSAKIEAAIELNKRILTEAELLELVGEPTDPENP